MKTIQSWWAWLLGTVVSMLGFSACNNVLDMYGCPPGDFRDYVTISSEVVDEDGRVIRGCRVVVAPGGFGEGAKPELNDTLHTDYLGRAKGTYLMDEDLIKSAEVKFEDAEPDGVHAPQTIPLFPSIKDDWEHDVTHTVEFKVKLLKKAE